jgi:hypothetical protein
MVMNMTNKDIPMEVCKAFIGFTHLHYTYSSSPKPETFYKELCNAYVMGYHKAEEDLNYGTNIVKR